MYNVTNLCRFAPCYETATTRAYYNGRTETLRACTMEVTNWAKAMLKSDVEVLPFENQDNQYSITNFRNLRPPFYFPGG